MSTTTTRSQRLTLICILYVLMGAPVIVDAVTCVDVRTQMEKCVPYFSSGGSKAKDRCCVGVKFLNLAAKTKGDRKQICLCLTNLYNEYSNRHTLNFNLVKGLPAKCGVIIPFNITRNPNCSNV